MARYLLLVYFTLDVSIFIKTQNGDFSALLFVDVIANLCIVIDNTTIINVFRLLASLLSDRASIVLSHIH